MRNANVILAVFLFFNAFSWSFAATETQNVCKRPLKVAWESYPPFQFQSPTKDFVGFDFEIVKKLFEKTNCKLEFLEMPFGRILKLLEDGDVDISIALSYTEERDKFLLFSDAIRDEKMVLFVKKTNLTKFGFKELAELKDTNFRLGITKGYFYGDVFEKLKGDTKFKKNILENTADDQSIKMLLTERIEGMLGDEINIMEGLKATGENTQVAVHPLPVYKNSVFIVFSKKSVKPEIVQLFNTGLANLRKTHTYADLEKKYFDKK